MFSSTRTTARCTCATPRARAASNGRTIRRCAPRPRALERLLAGPSPYIHRVTLQPGMGLLCNNVLHDRSGFVDDPADPRLIYRAPIPRPHPDRPPMTRGGTRRRGRGRPRAPARRPRIFPERTSNESLAGSSSDRVVVRRTGHESLFRGAQGGRRRREGGDGRGGEEARGRRVRRRRQAPAQGPGAVRRRRRDRPRAAGRGVRDRRDRHRGGADPRRRPRRRHGLLPEHRVLGAARTFAAATTAPTRR